MIQNTWNHLNNTLLQLTSPFQHLNINSAWDCITCMSGVQSERDKSAAHLKELLFNHRALCYPLPSRQTVWTRHITKLDNTRDVICMCLCMSKEEDEWLGRKCIISSLWRMTVNEQRSLTVCVCRSCINRVMNCFETLPSAKYTHLSNIFPCLINSVRNCSVFYELCTIYGVSHSVVRVKSNWFVYSFILIVHSDV